MLAIRASSPVEVDATISAIFDGCCGHCMGFTGRWPARRLEAGGGDKGACDSHEVVMRGLDEPKVIQQGSTAVPSSKYHNASQSFLSLNGACRMTISPTRNTMQAISPRLAIDLNLWSGPGPFFSIQDPDVIKCSWQSRRNNRVN